MPAMPHGIKRNNSLKQHPNCYKKMNVTFDTVAGTDAELW